MRSRTNIWLAVLPIALLLGVLAFVPELDRYMPGYVFIWGLPLLMMVASFSVPFTSFKGSARRVALLTAALSAATSLSALIFWRRDAVISVVEVIYGLMFVLVPFCANPPRNTQDGHNRKAQQGAQADVPENPGTPLS